MIAVARSRQCSSVYVQLFSQETSIFLLKTHGITLFKETKLYIYIYIYIYSTHCMLPHSLGKLAKELTVAT